MNERKTIFNATFEESQNFVTPKYIEHCFKESDNGVISKRTFGVFISSAILGLFAFLLSYVEKILHMVIILLVRTSIFYGMD